MTHTDTEFVERSLQFDETVTVISIDKDGNSFIMDSEQRERFNLIKSTQDT